MDYPLRDILRVRVLREEHMQNEMLKARNRVFEANQELEKVEKELEEYKEWLKEEEDRRYAKLINKKVKKERVTEVKNEIVFLRKKEEEIEKKVEEAKEALKKAKEDLETARLAYFQCIKDRQKIDEHKKVWTEEWKKEQEYLLEKEMEDFRVKDEEVV